MNERDNKDKAIFIVGFLAIFLAFSSFKSEFSQIYLSIGESKYSIFNLLVFFIILLTISVYLFALDYLRYNFGKYQNILLFRAIVPVANFFYSIAILFPIFVIILWIFGSEPIYGFTQKHKNLISYFDLIGSVLIAIIGLSNALLSYRTSKNNSTEIMKQNRMLYLSRAIQLFNQNFYSESVIEVYKVLEQVLKEKLLKEKDLSTKYISFRDLINLAIAKNILDKKSVLLIKELQVLRNRVAHSLDPITKKEAEFFINSIRSILENEKLNDSDYL